MVIRGRISGLLNSAAGEINGVVLDNGRSVHFPPDRASRALLVAIIGSRVEIQVSLESTFVGDSQENVPRITNLDSQQSTTLCASPTPQSPEVTTGSHLPHDTAAPLGPALERFLESVVSRSALPNTHADKEAVHEIENADQALHRIRAMLAHLKMVKRDQSVTSQYLEEAEHTYVQAISHWQVRDFEEARELAAASRSLSQVIDIFLRRIFYEHSDSPRRELSTAGAAIEFPDKHAAALKELDMTQSLLSRIGWVLENGTMPFEDRARVSKFSIWSSDLYRWANRFIESGAFEEAAVFAQAANAVACSAEHLCKKCYVTRSADLRPNAFAQ